MNDEPDSAEQGLQTLPESSFPVAPSLLGFLFAAARVFTCPARERTAVRHYHPPSRNCDLFSPSRDCVPAGIFLPSVILKAALLGLRPEGSLRVSGFNFL